MVYLDYSATTPLDPAVLKKMLPYFSREFANPASIHTPGQKALKAVDDARWQIADSLGIKATEIVFTSGATEANNLTLFGMIKALRSGRRSPHVITTAIEHDSILEPCRELERQGVTVTYLPVTKQGSVRPETLAAALTDETVLVSIGYVNSEIGVIQPIKKIGRLIKAHNERRYKAWLNTSTRKRGKKPQRVYFHTDATQAANFCDCNVERLLVDLMSLSSHKIYGPKGIGLLYIKTDTPIEALQYGGHQERNLRSGTLNVPAIIGFAEALRLAVKHQTANTKKIAALRDRLVKEIQKLIPMTIINTPFEKATPSHANIAFPGQEGDLLVARLDEKGIAASTGSACASGDTEASHVLTALGIPENIARSAVRFTLGKSTTKTEVDRAIALVRHLLSKN